MKLNPQSDVRRFCQRLSCDVLSDGFRISVLDICDFNSTDLKNIEFIRSWYYNKVEFARFSSSLGEFVGFTEFGLKQAKYWNSDASYMAQLRGDKERYCQHNIQIWYNQILDKSAEPYVRLHSATPPGGHHPSMLVCSVFDFYPQHIKVSWLRDGQEVTSDVTSTDELADADWSGEKISCVVEHASLKEPLITDWDPSLPESERNKIAIGASGLILGLILSLAGFIYYKRKARGQTSTDQNRPAQTSTDQHRPEQTRTDQYRPEQTSTDQYRPVQTRTDQNRPEQTSFNEVVSEVDSVVVNPSLQEGFWFPVTDPGRGLGPGPGPVCQLLLQPAWCVFSSAAGQCCPLLVRLNT
ncbi:H-2 class II histocompatibility antigen, I-A beta chain [Collichthys lucidus]|uniref:H-2 class II histocompatibility antigen, I-A beta chain n=1 Tax=Collichthys lucidus TaxID=240159 RepID=A0A4U5UYM7_COLLU|nr:H-2 class II histocompatibility antigen, I-A beta chain [Collichthys lucidus]